MSEKLIEHFRKYVEIDPKYNTELLNHFLPKTVAKKENLMAENTLCKFHFFVIKGFLRMFFVDGRGTEQTIDFAIENLWLPDYFSFEKQAKTGFTIQAVEKTSVLVIDHKNQEKLLERFPQLERYYRLIYQRAYSASQLRSKYLQDLSREQFYLH